MSEEELKAIERFKKIREETDIANRCGLSTNDFKEDLETYDAILNLIEKQQEKIDETKEEQFFLIHKITSKIDYFDYEYKRAKRQGDNERADFYCELSKNFKKLLEE